MPPNRRCPDCGVELEATKLQTGGGHAVQIVAGEREGVLGSLGLKRRNDVEAVVCPECGLVRLYAAEEE